MAFVLTSDKNIDYDKTCDFIKYRKEKINISHI